MIAGRLERRVDAAENSAAAMADLGQLAVHRYRRPHYLAAEGVANRLMAQADAEDRDFGGNRRDQIETDAGLLGRAGAGRKHDGVRIGVDDSGAGDLVIAVDANLRPQFTEIVHKVEGEAVVIVDQNDHDARTKRLAGS